MGKVTWHEVHSTSGAMHAMTLSKAEFLSFQCASDTAKQRIIDSIERADELKLEAVLEDLDCEEDIADALMVIPMNTS